jgi:hypothetical protein
MWYGRAPAHLAAAIKLQILCWTEAHFGVDLVLEQQGCLVASSILV